MRFTALLLLAALVGALVCAQDTTTDYIQGTSAEDSLSQSIIEKSLLLAEKAFEEAKKRASGGIQDGKQIIEGGTDFIQRLRKIFLDPGKIWFLGI